MSVDQRIIERLNELLLMGDQVLASKYSPGAYVVGDDRVDSQLAHQWSTSVQSLLARIFGSNSDHYRNFTKQVNDITYSPASRAQGVLKAAKDDYENEHLFEIRRAIEAELFDDFLEQAAYLLDSGYYQSAAVIAGCVLEDGLRKMCEAGGIALSNKPKLDKMNADLAKGGIVSKLLQKRITLLADLRNKAAHGEWEQFNREDVEEMVPAVRRIMEKYFS